MAFYIGNGVWSSVFAVPCDIVDRHIKLCSPLSLKVLMVILRTVEDMDIDELADALGQSRADVQDAMNYWITNGVIAEGEGKSAGNAAVQALQSPQARKPRSERRDELSAAILSYTEEPDEQENTDRRKIMSLTSARPRLTTREINEIAENDPAIGHLLQETQGIIGKPLTPVATDSIAALYSYYGMKPDIILMLVQYCVSIGKENMRYIEKVAAAWIEKGIDSHEMAEAEIVRLTKQRSGEGKIRSLFGINDRALASSEKKYIDTWLNEWRLEISLIEVAFERTIELKGKLSFAYINGILSNWRKTGIKTASQGMQEINKSKTANQSAAKSAEGSSTASYDMSKLESAIAIGGVRGKR